MAGRNKTAWMRLGGWVGRRVERCREVGADSRVTLVEVALGLCQTALSRWSGHDPAPVKSVRPAHAPLFLTTTKTA